MIFTRAKDVSNLVSIQLLGSSLDSDSGAQGAQHKAKAKDLNA